MPPNKRSRTEDSESESTSTKKSRVSEDNSVTAHDTPAAKFNQVVMRKLEKALAREPNLTKVFPSGYSSRLEGKKLDAEKSKSLDTYSLSNILSTSFVDDQSVNSQLETVQNDSTDPDASSSVPVPTGLVEVIHPLSDFCRVHGVIKSRSMIKNFDNIVVLYVAGSTGVPGT